MPKVSQAYRDSRRDQILSAARRCFLRDGFHATSMQDLFAEAGLSSGAVYRYFGSKDEMVFAIAEENMQDVVDMVHRVVEQQPDRSVGATIADVLDLVAAKHASDGLAGIAPLVWAEALRNPALAGRFIELLNQMRAEIAEVVRTNQGAGNLPADPAAEALATVLVSVVPGFMVQLALLGPAAVAQASEAVRALWPAAPAR